MANFKLSYKSDLEIPSGSYVYSMATTSVQEDALFGSYQPPTAADRLVVICSDDSMHILNPETLETIPGAVYPKVNSSLTCLARYAAIGQKSNTFLTAGRDGVIRGWDLRMSKPVLQTPAQHNRTGGIEPLSALAASLESHAFAAGTELADEPPGAVKIFVWDARKLDAPRITYTESHTDTITELRFLPYPSVESTVLLSGSTDGLVNVFDLTQLDEDDSLLQVINYRSAIHHTGLVGEDIFALGTDEKLSFHVQQSADMDIKDADPCDLGDLRERLGCEYAIGLRNHRETPVLVVGNHSREQSVRLVPLTRTPKEQSPSPQWIPNVHGAITLPGGHGEEIVRDVLVAHDARVVFTCGEDGCVKQWKG